MEICKQHPGKMWVYNGEYIFPIFSLQNKDQPFHSSQFASLPKVYVQNASLEIAWIDTIYKTNSIAGEKIIPFFTNETEGIDINNYDDLNLIDRQVVRKYLSWLITNGIVLTKGQKEGDSLFDTNDTYYTHDNHDNHDAKDGNEGKAGTDDEHEHEHGHD